VSVLGMVEQWVLRVKKAGVLHEIESVHTSFMDAERRLAEHVEKDVVEYAHIFTRLIRATPKVVATEAPKVVATEAPKVVATEAPKVVATEAPKVAEAPKP